MSSFLQSETVREFIDMVKTKRPHGSKAEKKFISQWIDTLPGIKCDAVGNRYVKIGDSNIAWSSHTDTVHTNGGNQAIAISGDFITLSSRGKSNCLGADCTTGVWLMVQMIRRKIPGLYIFHRGEEIGGIGSNHIATKTPELVADIDIMIALDRKDYNSIITHQFPGRTASNDFAHSLNDALGGKYALDDSGTFTDSANYVDLIAECTNLSVGYFSQHTKKEKQDITFLPWLLETLCAVDQSKLVVSRIVGEVDYFDALDEYEYTRHDNLQIEYANKSNIYDFAYDNFNHDDMAQIIERNPREIAELLDEYGLGQDEILQYVHSKTGR